MLQVNAQRTGGFRRYLATNKTTGFQSNLDQGRLLTSAEFSAITAVTPLINLGKTLTAQVIFFGTDANNETFDYRIWWVYSLSTNPSTSSDSSLPSTDPCKLILYGGTGVATLGNINGESSSSAVTSSDFLCDTITFTKSGTATSIKGPATDAETAFAEGAFTAYSPTGDTPGVLYLPVMTRASGMIIDMAPNTGASCNCLIMTDDV